MKPHLSTTPDGEIVYDPPHKHHLVNRNGELARCCSTRGTPEGRIGPVTNIPSGSGVELLKRTRARQKAPRLKHSQSAREKAGSAAIPEADKSDNALRGAAGPIPASYRADEIAGESRKPIGDTGGAAGRPEASHDGLQATERGPGHPDKTPSSQSMTGPSGKTATNAKSETPPNTTYPPTHATADLVASGATVVSAREVTTENGPTCVLTTDDGTDYWGSSLLLSQLDKAPDLLPDIVIEVESRSGRTYRTFSKARGKSARTFGRPPGA